MIEFPSNERYSAAPTLLNQVKIPGLSKDAERGTPDGDEGNPLIVCVQILCILSLVQAFIILDLNLITFKNKNRSWVYES